MNCDNINELACPSNSRLRTMATITVVAKNIRVYSSDDSIRYRVTFDNSFEAIAKNADGKYVKSTVNYIDFVPRVLIAQCLGIVEGLDLLYTKKKEQALRSGIADGFGAAELNAVLRDSKMTLEREKFKIGDEYTDADGEQHTHEHSGYRTTISDIKVTEKVQTKLDAMMDKMFDI